MAGDPKRPEFPPVNGIDISAFVKSIAFGQSTVMGLPLHVMEQTAGSGTVGELVLSGIWDDGRDNCLNCGDRFRAGPEGVGRARIDGVPGAVTLCPACFKALA